MLTRGRRCGMTGPGAAWTGTRHTSSPPMSQAPPGKGMSAGKLCPRRQPRGGATRGANPDHHTAVTHCDLSANVNRRSARLGSRMLTAECREPNEQSAVWKALLFDGAAGAAQMPPEGV